MLSSSYIPISLKNKNGTYINNIYHDKHEPDICTNTKQHKKWTKYGILKFNDLRDTICTINIYFFFSSRRRHTRYWRDWSSDVCSSDPAMAVFIFLYFRGLRANGLFQSNTAIILSEILLFCFTRRSEEHTSELQSRQYLVCRLLLEKKKKKQEQKQTHKY